MFNKLSLAIVVALAGAFGYPAEAQQPAKIGRTPADLPVEKPMKFEFIGNLNAAKQIGLTIPPNVLVRADKVIR